MKITEVSDHVLVDNTTKQEYLLLRVRSLSSNHRGLVLRVAEKHETLHFSDILHDLVLLHEMCSHTKLNHISSSHITSNSSLKNHSIALDSSKDLIEPPHTEVRLDPGSNLMNVVNAAAHNQTLQALLYFFCGYMKAQVLLICNSLFSDIKATIFVPRHVTSDGSLDIPGRLFIDVLFGQRESIVNNSLLQCHAQEELTNPINVRSVVRVLNDCFSSTETISQLVSELMSLEHILNALSSFLLLNLPSVSLVRYDGFLEEFFEVVCLLLLLLHIFETVPVLNATHSLQLVLEVECTTEDKEGLLDNFSFLVTQQRGPFHALVQDLLDLWHHKHFSVANGVLVRA